MRGKIIMGTLRKPGGRYFIDDVEVSKKEYDKNFPSKGKEILNLGVAATTLMETSKSWPRLSDAMGVNPNQREEAQRKSIEQGVPTEFTKDGRAVIRNNAHQRDLQRALGMVNNNAGYNQITG